MPVWNRIRDDAAGYAFSLSDAMSLLDWRFPGTLRTVDDSAMVIASDYSGQHIGASHEAYTFLVTTQAAITNWSVARKEFRARWLRDGRRVSFKRLRDRVRADALIPFLAMSSTIWGNLVTVLIDKRLKGFTADDRETARLLPECFPLGTPEGTVTKMLTLCSLLAMLVAGFRREEQESLWISDADEALATFERREGLARLASYLSFGYSHWKKPADLYFGTTDSPHAPEWSEDLAAIPDLLAGASCSLASRIPRFFNRKEMQIDVVSTTSSDDQRACVIFNWFAMRTMALQNVILRLELDDEQEVRASYQIFQGVC